MSAGVILAAVVLAGGGSCYTGPINMAPQISIIPPTNLVRGVELIFDADRSDPDGDRVDVEWSHAAGPCDGRIQPPSEGAWTKGETHVVRPPDSDSSFCVWARARDSRGAVAYASPYAAFPSDQGATVQLHLTGEAELQPRQDLTGTFALYRQIRFEVSVNDPEGDPTVDVEWSPAQLAGATLGACGGDDPLLTRCLVPTEPGVYTVSVIVTDTGGTRSSDRKTFRVADDALPCLALTEPTLETTRVSVAIGESKIFQVQAVNDDGEPYPALPPHQETTFSWFRGSDAGELQPLNESRNFYWEPAAGHFVGEKLRVRVEISDRNQVRTRKLLADCKDDTCASAPGCRQRMTWLIEYNQ